MALRASRKLSWLGTRLRMASVTRQPLRLRTDFWSRFLRREASRRLRLSATLGKDSRENNRSIWEDRDTWEKVDTEQNGQIDF